MKRIILIGAALASAAFAQQAKDRVVRFSPDIKFSGNLRTGPYNFTGSSSVPVTATISTMKISSLRAVLAAPNGTPITSAEGKRSADFMDSVTVVRGRLNAKGSALNYAEATGVGVLKGSASAVFAPEKQGDDPVNITAGEMSFDVDTDISTSKGSVKMVSGTQTGTSSTMVFDEKKELGFLTGDVQMNRAASGKQKALNVTGTEARLLTKNKLMYVKGKVRLVSGDITTTGDNMFYDDQKNLAVIVGNAVSVNAKDGTRVTGNVLEQRTDLGRVRQLTGGYQIPVDQFKLSNEK
ncbi:LptA/OstA family protein [Deinococcus peraridilitoris]|uniref:Organic solvent tolerance-like N-terminal domain-containing protein n=1 Tax=Deinococcus peraridilitoris (strain DSM 19664 / LMG 22246 / CIP 109416 / KR-200) TaxID=937777 RepID=L0A611_DEIPD|nr:LptA/OstA family protein [Deinococcus peraridilitoris]AFZ68460.1 hypothetical protein Deipe_3010 [Deinococcus peraridilitoris DSM 19664]